MARTPTRVPTTSGQGVSRRSYQVARRLGQRGTGSPMKAVLKNEPAPSRRDYAKASDHKPPKEGDWNIDYGSTLPIANLKDLK